MKSYRHIPLNTYPDFDDFYAHLPYGAQLIGIELDDKARDLVTFKHPERAVYLLGAEDHGLPQTVIDRCHHVIQLRGEFCLNVAVAGSIALYHRVGGFDGLADRNHVSSRGVDVSQTEPLAAQGVSSGGHCDLPS